MSGIFDTHAHYTDERFEKETGSGTFALLSELFNTGVDKIINTATDIATSEAVVAQAADFPGMYAAVGIHPSEIYKEGTLDETLGKLEDMLKCREKNKIVAIGEIGLDYYWQPVDKEGQAEFFEAQLELARKYGMPVSVHDRDAHGDVFETILRYPEVIGVLHSYSGSAEMARELLKRGWYVSFSGVLTFKNAARVRSVAQSIPKDRLLLETDCPYLAPEPHRGKLNRSDCIRNTGEVLGTLFGMSGEEMIALTNENACRLFNV